MATVNLPPTRVVNLRREDYDVYIGRVRAVMGSDDPWLARGVPPPPARGAFGNPWAVDFAAVRAMAPNEGRAYLESVLAAFEIYFERRVEDDLAFRAAVLGLRGKRLGCFCAPGRCHGDIIAAWVDRQPVAAP